MALSHFFQHKIIFQPRFQFRVISNRDLDSSNRIVRGESRYRSILPSASLKCSQIQNFIQRPFIKSIARGYLGIDAPIYSINTFATFPGSIDHYVLHEHRDYDHFFALAFFIAWTETAYDDGATFYAPSTHLSSGDDSHLIPLEAKAGEVFCLDTFGKHRGCSDLKAPRIATWIRYGTIPNNAWLLDGNGELMP